MKKFLASIAIVFAFFVIAPFAHAAVTFDQATGGSFTTASSGGTVGVTVGSNPNRVLIAFISEVGNSTCGNATYAGVSMTMVDCTSEVRGGGGGVTYILVNPASGTNNLVFGGFSNSLKVNWTAYSYYNAAQTGQPDNHSSFSNDSPISTSLTPNVDGTLFWAGAFDEGVNSTITNSGFPNNQVAPSYFQNPFNVKMIAGDNGIITPATLQTASVSESLSRMVVFAMSIAPAPPPVAPPSILNWILSWWYQF